MVGRERFELSTNELKARVVEIMRLILLTFFTADPATNSQ